MSDGLIVVDGHVHVYDCFSPARLFSSAWQNLHAGAAALGRSAPFQAVLLLTETGDCDWFRRTRNSAADERFAFAPWSIDPHPDEACSMVATEPSRGSLLLVAGFQAVTAEGLEILALATGERPPDGRSPETTLSAIVESEAIPVLPWGVGKWLGRRGALVERLLHSEYGNRVYLGDNAGRPSFWPAGKPFAATRARGRGLLSGSDPLPLAGEEARVGRAGFAIAGRLSEEAPARDLKRLLRNPAGTPVHGFGRRDSVAHFCRSQFRLRVERRPREAA